MSCTWSAEWRADLEPDDRGDRGVEGRRGRDVLGAQPQVVDLARLALVVEADGLDAVAVGVEQEGAVVLRRVLRARAGLAVARGSPLRRRRGGRRRRARAWGRRSRRAGCGSSGRPSRWRSRPTRCSRRRRSGACRERSGRCRRSAPRLLGRRPGSRRGRTRRGAYPAAPFIRYATSGSRSSGAIRCAKSSGIMPRVPAGGDDRVGRHDRLEHVVARLAVQREREVRADPAAGVGGRERVADAAALLGEDLGAAVAGRRRARPAAAASGAGASAGEGGDRHRRPRAGEATGGEGGGSHAA